MLTNIRDELQKKKEDVPSSAIQEWNTGSALYMGLECFVEKHVGQVEDNVKIEDTDKEMYEVVSGAAAVSQAAVSQAAVSQALSLPSSASSAIVSPTRPGHQPPLKCIICHCISNRPPIFSKTRDLMKHIILVHKRDWFLRDYEEHEHLVGTEEPLRECWDCNCDDYLETDEDYFLHQGNKSISGL